MEKEFIKKIFKDPRCKTQLALVGLCIMVCFLTTEFMSDTKWANFIAIGCSLFSVYFCNEFARTVRDLREGEENE